VVAGDNKQLPPTTFFAAGDDEEYASDEEAGAAEGFESLLAMMIPFVHSSYLDWHYRSRDEALINFSNHYIYQSRLVTFPGPGGPPVINHEHVRNEPGTDGQEESSTAEVRKAIEIVISHAREHQEMTLGVITMGIKHMNRLQAALDRELENHPELESFFDPNAQERFFVKNLERVQGDERDGASYHSSYTARDRDRLRQQQLENLGWRFHRIWSTDWFMRKDEEVTRAVEAFHSAVEYADKLDNAEVHNSDRNGNGSEKAKVGTEEVPTRDRGTTPCDSNANLYCSIHFT
jgi:hypothetical protein